MRNTKSYFSLTNGCKQAARSEDALVTTSLTVCKQVCSWLLEQKMGWTCLLLLNISAPALQLCGRLCWALPTCSISPSHQGARIKANCVSSVDCTQLMLMPQEHRALCSPASGCQGWWFINHWHPLLEENTEKIWSLRNKVRITSDRKEAYLFRLLPRCCCLAVGTTSISGYSTKNDNSSSRSELGSR